MNEIVKLLHKYLSRVGYDIMPVIKDNNIILPTTPFTIIEEHGFYFIEENTDTRYTILDKTENPKGIVRRMVSHYLLYIREKLNEQIMKDLNI